VLPLGGAAPALPDRGAGLIAAALAEAGLPATAGQRTAQTRYLLGEVGVTQITSLSDLVVLSWQVYGPGGSLLARRAQEIELPHGRWRAGDPEALRRVGLEAAPLLAALAAGPEEVAARDEGPVAVAGERPRIVVLGVTGAPGDGNRSLARAVASVLTQRGFLVVDDLEPGGFAVDAAIERESAGDDLEKIDLAWQVAGDDGERLGQVEQSNVIPAGSLDGAWGDVAAVVAVGAVDGIVELLRKAGRL